VITPQLKIKNKDWLHEEVEFSQAGKGQSEKKKEKLSRISDTKPGIRDQRRG
jgi:hypothetical protein